MNIEMVKLTALTREDLRMVEELHAKGFAEEFDLPDFTRGFFSAFKVTDTKGKIIAVSGVRPIAESIVLTDKEASVRQRTEALIEILQASTYLCKKFDFTQLHCFITDEEYRKHLEKFGFKPTKGIALVRNV